MGVRTRAASTVPDGTRTLYPFVKKQEFVKYGEQKERQKRHSNVDKGEKTLVCTSWAVISPLPEKILTSVLLAIHAERKEQEAKPGEAAWKLTDDKAESWAEHMARRIMLMRRHVQTGGKG